MTTLVVGASGATGRLLVEQLLIRGQNDESIAWTAVCPDNLINADKVTKYEVYSSPIRSAIFDPGLTSRINVGYFMADLITDDEVWNKWKGQMPVIYNTSTS